MRLSSYKALRKVGIYFTLGLGQTEWETVRQSSYGALRKVGMHFNFNALIVRHDRAAEQLQGAAQGRRSFQDMH